MIPMSVLITGATGGIGGALAEAYARPGVMLILHGRNESRLAELKGRCEALGARVIAAAFDLRDGVRLSAWLKEVCAGHPVDLLVVNAGVNTNIGPSGKGERWEDVRALLEINVVSALATVDGVLPSMRARGRGQIALIEIPQEVPEPINLVRLQRRTVGGQLLYEPAAV